MTGLPRSLNEEQQDDASLISSVLRLGPYKPGWGIFHYSSGPYWPDRLRRFADRYEQVVPALRRMADHLEATQPEQQKEAS